MEAKSKAKDLQIGKEGVKTFFILKVKWKKIPSQ
jgi:hypothetical protein